MATFLKFNGIRYPVLRSPLITNKTNELVISNVTIDFTGNLIEDLPFKYQEVRFVEFDSPTETTIFIAYVDDFELPTYKTLNEVLKLSISLFSPKIFSTKRTITAIVKDNLQSAVVTIVQPLITDGFTILENDLSTSIDINETYIKQTIEKTLNSIARKHNFIWFIDEFKQISFLNIDNLITQTPILEISDTNKPSFLSTLKPIIRSVDYANVINIKNIKLYKTLTNILNIDDTTYSPGGKTFKLDEVLNFVRPVELTEEAMERSLTISLSGLLILGFIINNTSFGVRYISANPVGSKVVLDATVGYDGIDNDDSNKKVLLIRDSNDANLITGIKLNYAANPSIQVVSTFTALVPFLYSFYDSNEINLTQPLSITSGIIEKSINVFERRFGLLGISEFARGELVQSNNETGEVKIVFEDTKENNDFELFINNDLELAKTIKINLPSQLIVGDFIIIDFEFQETDSTFKVSVTAKNKNLNETFLDIYRKDDIDEKTEQIIANGIGVLIEDEKIIETPNVVVNGVVVNEFD